MSFYGGMKRVMKVRLRAIVILVVATGMFELV
jgi:hypothetical protein